MPKGKTVHMNNKTLSLTLKKKWFDLILSGEKVEEYREIKIYWFKRLIFAPGKVSSFILGKPLNEITEEDVVKLQKPSMKRLMIAFKPFTHIKFKNGYQKNAPEMTVKLESIEFGEGSEEHGAEAGKQYFVLKLGEIVESKNCSHE